jgi:hypothetical protein
MTFELKLGPAWEGWESYNLFEESVKNDLRFVRSKPSEQFLNDVRGSCPSRKIVVPKSRAFWRARLGCEYEDIEREYEAISVVTPEERPYDRNGMKPIPNWRGEGRANPRGIPVLYLATDRITALAEVRPWIGAVISAAQLVAERELSVIDCSTYHASDSLIDIIGDHSKSREDGIWVAIDRAFATPVSKEDEARDYIPTQVLADLFKAEGYDGLLYKSLLSKDGFNVALFNLNDAKVESCALFKLDSIDFKFVETGTQTHFG